MSIRLSRLIPFKKAETSKKGKVMAHYLSRSVVKVIARLAVRASLLAVSTLVLCSQLLTVQTSTAKTPITELLGTKMAEHGNNSGQAVADIFDYQAQLLKQSLDAVKASKPDEIEWYFVGVAGYAGQNVFRSETNYARALFDRRFNTRGHSVALINNEYSWAEQPIATKETLTLALQDIGDKMGEEDVLFLSMSSHGNQNVFELQNYLIDIDNIEPDWLRQTLDDAGVKWRVIAISACFSGSFIDELSSPNTMIITAAAEDRSSFGCTNTAKMTYFGEAFYANSLGRADSFMNAYKNANRQIKAREFADGFTPSNPQFVVGEAMKQQLPIFEKVLFQSSRTGKRSRK